MYGRQQFEFVMHSISQAFQEQVADIELGSELELLP